MIASLRTSLGRIAVLAVLLGSLAPLATPAPAYAQTEEARILFERGNEHLARGLRARGRARERELSQALDAYLGVLRLNARTRNVVFNLALTLAELGRTDEAFNYYSEYLRVFDLSDDERSEGQRRLDALRPSVAVLRIESAPEGAEVRVDRRDLPVRGTTPLELAVAPGSHEVFLTRPGFVESSMTGTAAVGRSARVWVELAARPVDVQVIAPGVGTLTLDGQPIAAGRTVQVAPGPHVVRLEVPGAPPIERRFEVAAGDAPLVLELSASGMPAGPRLAMSIDTHADVFVDNLRVGQGARLEIPMPPGPHEVRVVAPGRTPLVHHVSLEPQETLRLSVQLGHAPDATGVHAARAVLGVLAAGAVATSIGLYARAQGLWDQWNREIAQQTMPARYYLDLADRVEEAALATDIALSITAGVGLAALITLFVDPGSPGESTVEVGAAPTPGGGVASVTWRAF